MITPGKLPSLVNPLLTITTKQKRGDKRDKVVPNQEFWITSTLTPYQHWYHNGTSISHVSNSNTVAETDSSQYLFDSDSRSPVFLLIKQWQADSPWWIHVWVEQRWFKLACKMWNTDFTIIPCRYTFSSSQTIKMNRHLETVQKYYNTVISSIHSQIFNTCPYILAVNTMRKQHVTCYSAVIFKQGYTWNFEGKVWLCSKAFITEMSSSFKPLHISLHLELNISKAVHSVSGFYTYIMMCV